MTHRMSAIVLALVLSHSAANAQPAFQVKDINPTDGERPGWLSLVQTFATLGTDAYFLDDDGVDGPELWKSDGTGPGTVLVKDVCPGSCGGWPRGLTTFGGDLYFTADDGVHGRELWKTDGTAAGTILVKDIRPGLGDGLPTLTFRTLGGYLYFAADDGVHGPEIWRTDGTEAGTTLVADIRPGAAGSNPVMRASGGGLLLFSADDGVHGGEPWVTDGTATAMVKDINPGAGTSVLSVYAPQPSDVIDGPPQDWIAAPWGGFLFAATDGTSGVEVWITDGTEAGTSLVKDIYPGDFGSNPGDLTPMGGLVYFSAYEPTYGNQIWTTDGTPAGTTRVSTIDGGPAGGWPRELTRIGSTLFFLAHDLDHGRELWKTDGTPAGTVLVKDITPGADGSFGEESIYGLTDLGGKLLFFARTGTYWTKLWSSDGTDAGTVPLADLTGLITPTSVTIGWSWTSAGGRLFFNGFGLPHGFELWASNGTGAGTGMVRRHDETTSSIPVWLGRLDLGSDWGALGSRLLFPATDGVTGREPWISNGTTAGTSPLGDLYPGESGSFPGHFTPFGGAACFSDNQGLWKTDGTPAGTAMLHEAGEQAGPLVSYGAYLLFPGNWGTSGVELWRTNGTAAGTVQVRDIALGPNNSSYPAELTLSGGLVYFRADDGAIGSELWRSDATYAGTWRVKDIRPVGASSAPSGLADLGGVLLFSAETDGEGRELWRSTGTEAATVLVKDVRPGAASSIRPMDEWGDLLRAVAGPWYYFVADDGTSGEELWRSDGTAAGTVLVKDVFPGARGAEPRSLTAVGSRLYFVADDGDHGREVWVTDGTEAGTHLVKDIVAGAGSPVPRSLTAAHGVLLFTAWDAEHGAELWKSDGTAAGTVLLQDIAPGAASSSPLSFTVAGPWIYFAANDGLTGFEPWVISRAALGSALDFYTVPPCRLIDTRTAGGLGGPLGSGTPRVIPAAGSCGIPDDATALSVNLTVIATTASGRLVLYAGGAPTPGTSSISFGAGQTRANNALVSLGPAGLEALATLVGSGQVDVILDVNGYFK